MFIDLPVTISIGEGEFNVHILFEIAAFYIGYRYYMFLRKGSADAISSKNRVLIVIGAAIGALIFSRLIGNLEDLAGLAQRNIAHIYNSKTIVGGLLGGLLGVEITKKIIGEKKSSGDMFTYPLILAMIIGRIGCFLSGISEPTFGLETNLPWGMDLGDGLSRHPTSLYEIFFLGALWFFLKKISGLLKRPGDLFKLFLAPYLLFRFCIEFIKPHNDFLWGLSAIHVACIIGLIYYTPDLFRIIFNRSSAK